MNRRYVFLLLRFSCIPFLIREVLQGDKVTILCYHDPKPNVADAHIRKLKKLYNIIPLRDYIDWRNGRRSERLPQKALVLTIDDGHKNNYHLKDVIKKHNVPVTIFLCSDIVGTMRHYWWSGFETQADIESLKRIPDNDRVAFLESQGIDEDRDYESREALSADEILDLKELVDLQSHGRFHPILPKCTDERARDDIIESKQVLQNKYNLDIYAFAYPNGDYSKREMNIIKNSEYECALTLDRGFNNHSTDLAQLKRIPIYDYSDINELIVKACGLWDLVSKYIGKSYQHIRP